MKCPRCGERMHDPSEEYALEVCDRCQDDEEWDGDPVPGPCSHLFNGDRCDLCGAAYDPIAHGHRIVPEDDVSW